MKIVNIDVVEIHSDDVRRLNNVGEFKTFGSIPNKSEGIKRIIDADIVIDNWFDMPAEVIAAAKNLKMISVGAIGYEWVDINEAKKRNIVVSNSPAYCAESVAEHTIGLILSAARLSPLAEREAGRGMWKPTKYKGKQLSGKTLGVLGYGSIGTRVAKIASNGLGMKILYFNTETSKEDFRRLLKTSDVIAITLPLNEKTRGIIGKEEFDLMKSEVIMVNTGRGAVVDEKALITNLESGKIFSVGLDVLAIEPPDKGNPLFKFPNVTITPHIAFNTEESLRNLSKIVTDNILAFLKGNPINVVN